MSTTGRSRADEMLDLLAEAVAARLEARAAAKAPAPVAPAAPLTAAETAPDLDAAEDMEPEVAPAPHADASRLIRRLALGLLVILLGLPIAAWARRRMLRHDQVLAGREREAAADRA